MRSALLALLLLPVSTFAQADGVAPLLHRDPFESPAPVATPSAEAEKPLPPPWPAQLRMTVRAGRQSMVNVDGKTVPLGGKYDGYTLVAVEERSATFSRDGRTITLGLDNEPPAKAETPMP